MDSPSPPAWVKEAVFYQIFPDAFARSERVPKPKALLPWDAPPSPHGYKGGDLLGVSERLDYLLDLGVNALYLCPVFWSASNHRYHTYDYSRVDPMLGGNDALRELLEQAHARGMRVILDGVFNHAGRGLFQFHDLLENGLRSPYADWFVIPDKSKPLNPYDARAIARGRERWATNYRCWWNLPALPEFNTDNPEVREFLWGVATRWIEFGIDGWRLDVPECIADPSFWREFRRRVKAINPDAYLVGEIWGPAGDWLTGDRFDAVMNYVFSRACLCFFGGSQLDTGVRPGGYRLRPIKARTFARRIEEMLSAYSWPTTLAQLNLLGSHDTPRVLSMLGGDVQRLKLTVLFQMTFPGAPCIYYGDEVGMTSAPVPGHEGRAAMQWDENEWNVELLTAYKRYVALRKEHPALRRGTFVFLHAANTPNVYAFLRRWQRETLVVVLNNDEREYEVRMSVRGEVAEGTELTDLLSGGRYKVSRGRLSGPPIPSRTGVVLKPVVAESAPPL